MRTPRLCLFASLLVSVLLLSAGFLDAAAQTLVFVSSRNTHSVKYYDFATSQYLGDFVAPGSGGLNSTQEVLIGPNGNLLVTGRGNAAILEYDIADGTFLGAFSSGYTLDNPTKMTLGPDGNLYVSQWGTTQNKVARFDATSGAFVDEFTSIGLNQGCGHAWDAQGNLYVASFGSADVRKFGPTGTFQGVFTAPGTLSGAVNLWFRHGDLFVADWTLGSVLRFDGTTGALQSTFVSGLRNVEGFAFGPDGNLYLCDWTLNRINRYDPASGAWIGLFTASGGMLAPNSLVFSSSATPTETTTWGRIKGLYRD